MYDNISFYLDSSECGHIDLLDEVLRNGDDIKVEKLGKTSSDISFAYISITGRNNQKLSFKVQPFRISMMGKCSSICKYYLGHNFETLSLEQFNDAIKEISLRLGVNIGKARVCRVDLATNFIMTHSPSSYHSCLTHLPRYTRGEINGNLYFKTRRIELNFYDKKKEYRQKGSKIPHEFKDVENILRYEIRFKKDISKVFGRVIQIKDLCKATFYEEVYNKWIDSYWNISKQNPVVFDYETSTFKTSDFKDYFMVQGVEATGGIKCAYVTIEESKKAKTITSHKATYLRRVLENAYENPITSGSYDFVTELNNKMRVFKPPI